jgi:tripartite-type tricarboxylate transporter receptor subunit TctC
MTKVKLPRRTFLKLAAGAASLSTITQIARAEAYPDRPVTLVVPFPPGGPTDVIARFYADTMAPELGQSIIVENVAGAGGTIGSARVARASPDGYTLLIGHTGTHAANGAFYSKLPYDPINDYEYIGSMGDAPQILIAKKGAPNNPKDFAEHVRADQAKMNVGTAGIGSASHLGCAMLNFALGTQVQAVHYRGVAPAMNDLIAGQIDYMVDMSTTSIPQIQGGNVVPIVIMRSKRLSALPDIPTSFESGVANLDIAIWNVLMAPRKTPRPIIDRLNGALRKAAATSEVKTRLAALAVEIPDDDRMSPEGAQAFVNSEVKRWVPALKKAGIQPID